MAVDLERSSVPALGYLLADRYSVVITASQSGAHGTTAVCTFLENLSTDLAVIGVVTRTFVGAFLTHVSTDPGELPTVARITGYESGVKRRDIDDIPTEPNTSRHLLAVVYTLIGTPLTNLGRLLTVLDTLALLIAETVDLGDGFCKRHHVSYDDNERNHYCACLCWEWFGPRATERLDRLFAASQFDAISRTVPDSEILRRFRRMPKTGPTRYVCSRPLNTATKTGMRVAGSSMGVVGSHPRVVVPLYGSTFGSASLESDRSEYAPGRIPLRTLVFMTINRSGKY